ncbi:MAG TPA: ABC transporter ATP-binding protein [Myxococcaceae bacterium]|nr:ABC transporter ATP-binding protein [Myxococcaceae bacterium]
MDAIVLRKVSKDFRKSTIRREYTTLKSELVRFLKRTRRPEAPSSVTHALRDVSLTVPRGRTVGLVGRNGSGKSTLLKLVTGIYRPTSGTVEVNGRISALLELGAGFHPDFSGRENITVNGIILGMSRREIRERMQQIIDFSELGDFIDEPVRTYSSGMYARLAFSVATHVDPDLLIIDEILSVGDEHFARKSMAKMEEFRRSGKTILLVTHDMGTLQTHCDEALWLDAGILRAHGDPAFIVSEYRKAVAESEVQAQVLPGQPAPAVASPVGRQPRSGPPAEPGRRWGTFEAEVVAVQLRAPGGGERAVFDSEEGLEATLAIVQDRSLVSPTLEVSLFSPDGTLLWRGRSPLPSRPESSATLHFDRLGLADGNYRLDVAVFGDGGRVCCDFQRGFHGFAVRTTGEQAGLLRPVHRWKVEPRDQPG